MFIELFWILRKIGSLNILPYTGHTRNYIYECSLKPYDNRNAKNSLGSCLHYVTEITTC